MRLPTTAHTSQPWRIHEIAHDFRVEDVWALPTPGGPGDFARLMGVATSTDPERGSSAIVRALFAIRWKLGELLGWEHRGSGTGARTPSRGRRRCATGSPRICATAPPPRSSADHFPSARCT
jgi:hypothetical protein